MGLVNTCGLENAAKASGLTPQESELIEDLVRVLKINQARNAERTSYYEGEQGLRNIGIAIPPELTWLRLACSWPTKAVDALADRSIYDGVSFKGGEDLADINPVLMANRLASKYNKAKRTQGMHGCSFLTVGKGTSERLPVVIHQHSAESSSAIWDDEQNRIKAGLVIVAFDRRPGRSHKPILVNVYTEDCILVLRRAGNGRWMLDRKPHAMGRPMMEAMVLNPTTEKPLGSSRISKAVMSITDCAVREALRSEIHAEMFTAPQKYLIGASKKQAQKLTRYEAFFGSIFALEREGDSDRLPEFGQLTPSSMEPHISYMPQLAAQFAGATDVPISTLGVIHDNPSSAEAIHAAEQPLVIKAEAMNQDNAVALETIVQMAIAVKLNKPFDDLTAEEAGVVVGFKRPDRPSLVSMANAAVMIASTPGLEWFGSTEVCLEMLNFTETERIRLLSDKRQNESRLLVGQYLQGRQNQQPEVLNIEDVKEESDADNGRPPEKLSPAGE